jgi:hypothetical protein
MHSIRETAGVLDTLSCYRLFKGFWEGYQKLNVDLLGKWKGERLENLDFLYLQIIYVYAFLGSLFFIFEDIVLQKEDLESSLFLTRFYIPL